MLGLIRQEVIELIPNVIALCGICLLVLIACLVTRGITIKHMNHHLPEIAKQELWAQKNKNEQLKKDNQYLKDENENLRTKIKAHKAISDTIIL